MKRSLLILSCFCLLHTNCVSATTAPTLHDPFVPQRTAVVTAAPAQLAATGSVTAGEQLRIYPLSYTVAQSLQERLQKLWPQKLLAESVSNSLILQATPTEQQRLQQLLQSLDVPTRQVTLEAKVISVSREDSKSLGINWNWDTIPQRKSYDSDSSTDSDSKSSSYGGNFKFWRGYAFRFNATLNALVSQGKARILATPRIITIPGKEASIFIGDHIPVQTEKHDSSGTYTATEYLDAGIKLRYTPIISQDGKMVTATVHTEVSTPVLISELRNYRITSRTADTNVRLYSGETLVIGGLINEEQQRTIRRVPLLSSIPILGELFKSRTRTNNKTEVILLLTPHITEAGVSPAIYGTMTVEDVGRLTQPPAEHDKKTA